MKDIQNREDIVLLITSFYTKVRKDEMIGFIFEDVAKVDWDSHLPMMFSFWESTLFGTGNYSGSTMDIHQQLNSKVKLTQEHFKCWEELFHTTVNELFNGENAEKIKQRATSIKTIMELKICFG